MKKNPGNLKRYKGKNVVVPWSGGLDSTAALLGLAAAGANVTAVSLNGINLPNPNHEELARTRLSNIIAVSALGRNIKFTKFTMPGIVGDTAWPNNFRYAQKHFWLSLLSFLIPKETGYIAVGAVADDTVSMNEDVIKQWKASSWNIKESVTQPKIFFPLLKMGKEDIVPWLRDLCADFGISDVMKNISFCDSTTNLGGLLFSCGKCSSCQVAIRTRTHTLQPKAGVPVDTRGYHALRDLVKYRGGAGFFKIKETTQTYSYFLAVDVKKGEGTERLYAQDNPVSFDKNAMAVIYLGMGTAGVFEDDSFNELPSLLDGCVVVNKTEYNIRKLTYLLNANYTDIDVDDHVDVIAMRE